MKCPKCQTNNKEGANFCIECGYKFELKCPQCSHPLPPAAKFCEECGYQLSKLKEAPSIDYSKPKSYTPKSLADRILTTRSSIEGERKLVTVLFADVASYTSMAEKLDPEEVRQIVDGCFHILMDEIHKWEGTITQFTGDGLMALFGAPIAHEDHAQRACYSALLIQKAMVAYGEKVRKKYGFDFKMRIGLNSGPVVVGSIGDDLRMDYTAIGDTTNLAARVEQAAKPGEVWMSQETRNIIRGYFKEESVGEIPLKGKAQPQHLYRLISDLPDVRTRFAVGLARGMTDLVGRRPEMDALRSAYERVKEGEAQVVGVVGEPGVGKSRLVYEFQKILGVNETLLTGICVPYGRNINFLPVIDLVKACFGIVEGMSEEEVGKRIEEKAQNGLAPMIPFYRNLLSLKVDDPRFNVLDPEGRKFGTFEAVKNLLLAMNEEKPLVIFLEDVHWMDKISEEFFTYFSHCIHGHKILMISAYRPEGAPPWAQGTHYQRLGLETLSLDASTRLVRNILGGLPLDPALEKKIVEKTEGNPLFVEEIIRNLLDRGDLVKLGDRYIGNRPIDQLEIPNTIQGLLAARMDRLSEDLRQTMQVASVIGKDFAFRLLKSIMELGEELRVRLTNLVGLEILYEKTLYPELEYIFKHALTQEVAYESLLKQRRQEIHGRIARAIEGLYADRLPEHYELLAHHYGRSGNAEKAIEYLMLAGEKSNQNKAAQAACEFFREALRMVESAHISLDPDKERRIHQGLAAASVDIGDINTALEKYRKAMEVCHQHGMIAHEMEILVGFAGARVWRSRLSTPMEREDAIRFYEERIARARDVGDKGAESRILSIKGFCLASLGHWYEGYKMTVEAEAMALQTGNPQAVVTTRGMRAVAERWLGRPGKTVELTEGVADVLSKMFNLNQLSGLIFIRGLSLAEIGRIDDAFAELKHGIDLCEKLGGAIHLGRLYNALGYCYSEIRHPEEAWKWNLKSDEIARKLMEQYRMGGPIAAEIVANANVNLMENLFDQENMEEVWSRIKSFEEESKSPDYNRARDRWEARLDCLTSLILLQRNNIDEAEAIIIKNLEISRREHTKKIEGRFLRLLGEVQMKRNDFDNAISSMSEAILILKEVGNPRQLWQAYASMASVYDKLRRGSEAREQRGAAAEVIQKTATGLSDRELRQGFLNARPIRDILAKTGS